MESWLVDNLHILIASLWPLLFFPVPFPLASGRGRRGRGAHRVERSISPPLALDLAFSSFPWMKCAAVGVGDCHSNRVLVSTLNPPCKRLPEDSGSSGAPCGVVGAIFPAVRSALCYLRQVEPEIRWGAQIAHSSRNCLRLNFEVGYQLRDPPWASRVLLCCHARIDR